MKKAIKSLLVLSSMFLVTGVLSSCGENPTATSSTVEEAKEYSGIGEPPAALGKDGDTYIDTKTQNVYKKQGGVWILVSEHQSATYSGDGAPANDLGEDGDKYTDLLSGTVYEKRDGTWVVIQAGDKTYVVTFNLNGGSFPDGSTTYPSQTIREGRWVSEPIFQPSKEHCNFLGWYAEGSNTAWNFIGNGVYGNVNLIAQYSVNEEEKITVNVDPRNGQPIYTVDTFVGDRLYPQIPTKDGYAFGGWYVLSTETKFSGTVTAKLNGDTLYANWEEAKFNVSYEVDANGEATITGILDVNSISISIPDVINGHRVTKISKKAFNNRVYLETIYLPSSVRVIEEGAFADTMRLVSIIMDSNNPYYTTIDGILYTKDMQTLVCYPTKAGERFTVPSTIKRIGDYAFYYTRDNGIKSITFNEGLEEIGERAFALNETISNIVFPSTLKRIGKAAFFGSTYGDESESGYVSPQGVITNSSFNEGLEEIGEMAFANQYFKETFELPSTVKVIGPYCFANCTAIEKFIVPAGLEVFGDNAFAGATGILDVAVAPGNTHFKAIDGVIYDYDVKKVVMCPSGRTEKVTIPNGVTEIGDFAFYMCDELHEYEFPTTLTKIGQQAFAHTYGLQTFTIPDSVTEIGYECFDRSGLSSVQIGTGLQSIAKEAFIETKLTSVVIPGNVKTIGQAAFQYCNRLTNLVLNEGVEEIGKSAFSSTAVNGLAMPNSLKVIGDTAFAGAKVTSLDITDNLEVLGNQAFAGETSNSITSISVSSANTNFSVNNNILYSKDGKEVILAASNAGTTTDGVTYTLTLPDGVTKIADYAFAGNKKISTINFPETLLEIGQFAFYDSKTEELTLPSNLKKIADYAFYSCDSKKINFGSGLEEIGAYAFTMAEVEKVILPNSLKKVGEQAFARNLYLSSLTLGTGLEEIGSFAFGDSKISSVMKIPACTKVIGDGAFGSSVSTYGQNMAGFVVDEANPYFTTNGELLMSKDETVVYAFAGGSTTNLVVPESVKEIANYGLSATGARNTLKTISLPSSLEKIGECSIAFFTGVQTLTIPASVTYVGKEAFDSWNSRQSIIFNCSLEYALSNFHKDYISRCSAEVAYRG